VRDVDDDAKPIHLADYRSTQPTEPRVGRLFATIAYRTPVVVSQLDDAHAKSPVELDKVWVVLEWMRSLKLEDDREKTVLARCFYGTR
jgi:hypothetical protein